MHFKPCKADPKLWWLMDEVPVSEIRTKPERDIVLIVGDGKCMLEDLKDFAGFGVDHDTMALNYAALAFQAGDWPFEHYIVGDSHHQTMQDVAKSLEGKCVRHCWNHQVEGFDIKWIRDYGSWRGTTANLALKIAIALDYTKIVFAGVPMDNSGHWYDEGLPEDDIKRKNDHRAHLHKWKEIARRPVARLIRAMSGNLGQYGLPENGY
jgi:hypothetical protein